MTEEGDGAGKSRKAMSGSGTGSDRKSMTCESSAQSSPSSSSATKTAATVAGVEDDDASTSLSAACSLEQFPISVGSTFVDVEGTIAAAGEFAATGTTEDGTEVFVATDEVPFKEGCEELFTAGGGDGGGESGIAFSCVAQDKTDDGLERSGKSAGVLDGRRPAPPHAAFGAGEGSSPLSW